MTNTRLESSEVSSYLQVLAERLRPHVRAIERRYSLSPCDSEDALQYALFAFVRLRDGITSPQSWLYRVFLNRCRRIVRSRPGATIGLDDVDPAVLEYHRRDSDASRESAICLEQILKKLTTRSRKILWMRFVAEMSWKEIGASLGCRASGAKKAVYRALKEAKERASGRERVQKERA